MTDAIIIARRLDEAGYAEIADAIDKQFIRMAQTFMRGNEFVSGPAMMDSGYNTGYANNSYVDAGYATNEATTGVQDEEASASWGDLGKEFVKGLLVPDTSNMGNLSKALAGRTGIDLIEAWLISSPRAKSVIATLEEFPALEGIFHSKILKFIYQFAVKDQVISSISDANTGVLDDVLGKLLAKAMGQIWQDSDFLKAYQQIRGIDPSKARALKSAMQNAGSTLDTLKDTAKTTNAVGDVLDAAGDAAQVVGKTVKQILTPEEIAHYQAYIDEGFKHLSNLKGAQKTEEANKMLGYLEQFRQTSKVSQSAKLSQDLAILEQTVSKVAGGAKAVAETAKNVSKATEVSAEAMQAANEVKNAAKLASSSEAQDIVGVVAKLGTKFAPFARLSALLKYAPIIGLLANAFSGTEWLGFIKSEGAEGLMKLAETDTYKFYQFIIFCVEALGSIVDTLFLAAVPLTVVFPYIAPVTAALKAAATALGAISLGGRAAVEGAHFLGDPDGGISIMGNDVGKSQKRINEEGVINANLNTPVDPAVAPAIEEAYQLYLKGYKVRDILPQLRSKYPFLQNNDMNNAQYAQFSIQLSNKIKTQRAQAKPKTPFVAPSVSSWQAFLNKSGFKLVVDNIMGPLTANATKAYQAQKGLPQTGMIDEKTITKAKQEGFAPA